MVVMLVGKILQLLYREVKDLHSFVHLVFVRSTAIGKLKK